MKKLSLVLFGVFAAFVLNAQSPKPVFNNQESVTLHATEIPVIFLGITPNLRDLPELNPNDSVPFKVKGERDWPKNICSNPDALPNGPDPALQHSYPAPVANKALAQNWNGLGYSSVNPADPTVDVGPNHVVQMINGSAGTRVRVYSKTGTAITGVVTMASLCGTASGDGDPIVLYDERADRWVLTEFLSSGNKLLIAVSTTADPTGSYYTYSITSTGGFPDYPKYSIWNDAYIVTANVGSNDIIVFNRTSMLTGGAAGAQYFSQPNFGTIAFQAATPVSLMGTTNPPAGAPGMVMRIRDDAWSGSSSDALEIWELNIDWAVPGNSTFAMSDVLPVAAYDSDLCGYTTFNCVPQPGTSTKIDPLREVLMNRIMYRNFGSHESIVCCHVTDVNGADLAGVRWYELRRSGGVGGTWAIYQQGTYSPDNNNRFMGSIGISESGNIGLMYNVSSSTVYPSIRYTGRKECDPLNQMTEPETTIIAGNGVQGSGTGGRYGDYNAMGVDPSDGETFYCTAMYNPTSSWATRIAAFNIDLCAQNPEVSFDNSTYSVNEPDATIPASACLDYQIINVPISIGAAPTQNASITITVTGGSATQGVDYVLNNTSFILNGGNLTETVEVWVYNDNVVEGTETIQLGYTLNANGGDAYAGVTNQSVTITINDDDLAPLSMTSASIILQQDFESGLAPFTTTGSGGDVWQVSNAAGASSTSWTVPNTNATQIAYVNDDACNCNMSNVNLYTPSFNLTGFLSASLNFDAYYENNSYAGNQEIGTIGVSTNGLAGPFTTVYNVPGGGSWQNLTVDLSAYVGQSNVVVSFKYNDATGWLYGFAVDNVEITGQGPIAVQTAVNTGISQTANLGGNQTVHFYDPTTGNVMMTLENTSSFDYGCVTVEVDRAGTSALQFNTATTADFLASKTFSVTPTNNNPSGTYNITVYYEEAEVAGWEAVTGNSRANAEIIKVAGANLISDVNPGNAGTFTIANSATTLGAFYSDVTFTGSFSTGFSGFGLGVYNSVLGTAPVANFSATPTTICAGGTVTFTDLSANSPTSWSWDFGDAGTSTAQNPTHVYATAGTYSVTLIATNGNGSDPFTITNYITVNAVPTVTATGTATICAGQSTVISSSGATSYSWDNGAGSSASATVSPASTTTYTVTGTTAGCSNTAQVTVTVNPTPTVTASGTATICAGQSTTISASGATSYSWNNGAGSSASATVSPASTTTYTVTGTTAGCSNTAQVTVTVNPTPTVTALGTATICAGQSTVISASGATSYSWNNGAGSSASATVSPVSTTTYTVTGTTAGCSNTAQVTVTVNPGPSISVLSTNNPSTCATATGSIQVGGSGSGNVSWSGTATGSATGVSLPYTITGLAAGSYNITYTDGSGCVSNTVNQALVDPSAPTVTATGTTTICSGQSTTISASGATSYSWDNGAGSSASATVSPATTTTYTVTGTTAGCSNTAQVTVSVNPLPTVTATGTATICAGQSTVISASGATSYSWNNGAGSSASATVSPASTTTYTVTGTTAGCSNTAQVTVTVNPAPTVTATGTTTICAGQSTTISASGATSYSWNNGAGSSASVTVSPASTTTYTVTGTTAGCSNTAQVTVTVNPLPTVTATGTSTICAGQSTTISASGATSYSWDNGAGSSASATVSPASTTTYTVTGTTSGCSNTAQVTVTVNPLPTVTATGTTTICAGQSTTISASGATSYSWDNGVGTSATATVSPASTTTYTVTGTTAGCSNTAQVTVTVNPVPTVVATGTTDICEGSSTTISASGATSYSWDNGAGTSATATVSPTSTTTYTVTGTTAGCSNTAQVTITVNTLPTVDITPASIDPLCSYEAAISLTGSPAGGTFSGTGVSGSSFDPAIAGAGTHTITYSYTDGNGCIGTTSFSVEVKDCAGVPEEQLEGVALYPNPNDGSFVITGLTEGTTFQIFDERGRLILDSFIRSGQEEVQMPVVNNGIYYLKAKKDGKEGGIKFLIAR